MISSRRLRWMLLIPLIWAAREIGSSAPVHSLPRTAQGPEVNAASKVCEVASPTTSLSIPYLAQAPELNTDPQSATWSRAASAWIEKDCTHQIDYPKLKPEVRGSWTASDLN